MSLSGCSTVRYLWQAGRGQLALIQHSRPIPKVLEDARVPQRTKTLLSEIPAIKVYAENAGLKATTNYKDYVDLKRPAVVWVVSACAELEFKPMQWSFPIVGSFTYLGWFDRQDAIHHAEKLKQQPGWDVYVRGAGAYSTLGWFSDPVLSTMLYPGDGALGELVNVILHESVHATLYIKNQSYFNESVASFVADRMTPQYLESRIPAAMTPEIQKYLEIQKTGNKRAEDFRKAYESLEELYASKKSDEEKRSEKKKILDGLSHSVGGKEINNAVLLQYRTYGIGEPEFEALFQSCGQDWKRFFAQLHLLKPSDFSQGQLEKFGPAVLSRKCPAS